MHKKIVVFVVCLLLSGVSAAMLASGILSFFMDDEGEALGLLGCAVILLGIFAAASFFLRPNGDFKEELGMRDGFAIVGFSWIAATVIGMIPYIVVCGFHWYDALFETASGFSTTGATVVDATLPLTGGKTLKQGIESLPCGILFWRSLTQWMGGMGIVVLTMAILPLMNIGGQVLYNAEVSGVKSMQNKIAPRIKDSAKILLVVYLLLTVLQTLLLKLGGMGWFDSVCHSFTTIATGGFSTKQASIGHWSSPFIQWIMIVFMFLSGCNFALHYQLIRHFRIGAFWKNEEFRFYTKIVFAATVIISAYVWFAPMQIVDNISSVDYVHDPLVTVRTAVFQVVSVLTTTGFSTADYCAWPGVCSVILCILMFVTACGGSTTGGMKCVRILLMLKYAGWEVRRCLFPHSIHDVRINDTHYEDSTIQKTIGFCTLYIIFVLLFGAIIAAVSPAMHIGTALSASLSALSNIGPGFGPIGPAYTFSWLSPVAKAVLSFEMLLGRLELYTLLVLFLPSFWKK